MKWIILLSRKEKLSYKLKLSLLHPLTYAEQNTLINSLAYLPYLLRWCTQRQGNSFSIDSYFHVVCYRLIQVPVSNNQDSQVFFFYVTKWDLILSLSVAQSILPTTVYSVNTLQLLLIRSQHKTHRPISFLSKITLFYNIWKKVFCFALEQFKLH